MALLIPVLRSLAVALLGALLCVWIRTPLPWLIGPLVAVALVSTLRGGLASPPGGRQAGQWIIGVALGLYFSPDVVREVVRLGPWVALAVAFALALGVLGSWLLGMLLRHGDRRRERDGGAGGAARRASRARGRRA
jgi:uncharacterized protein